MHQHGAIADHQRRASGHDPADIVLFSRSHSSQAQIASDRLTIQLIARDMALFDTHDAKSFRAIDATAKRDGLARELIEQALAVACGNSDLIGQFAGER